MSLYAAPVLALCNMTSTLYLRNVPDEVVARLQKLAERRGSSVSAAAVAELAEVTKRADNAAILAGLVDVQFPRRLIVEGLEAERAAR